MAGGTWALIPIRGLEAGKSRLGGPLDAEERLELVARLLVRTIRATTGSGTIDGTIVVSPDEAALRLAAREGAVTVRQPGSGLNEALDQARDEAVRRGAEAVIVVPADLAAIDAPALAALVQAAAEEAEMAGLARTNGTLVLLVGDRRGEGTNVILLRPPDTIGFRFGPGSLAAHRAAAIAAGAMVVEPVSALDLDLDTPDDLLTSEAEAAGLEGAGVAIDGGGATEPDWIEDAPGSAGAGRAPIDAEVGERRPPPARVTVTPLEGIPEIRPGDDLAALLGDALERMPGLLPFEPGDVLVVTQKAVSKAEGAVVDLAAVKPRPEAVEFAERWGRDARQVEVVLREARRIVRMERGILIAETHHGFVCANAGVDASNVGPGTGAVVTLLPRDPDGSAAGLRAALRERFGGDLAVVVSDSFGRPWRLGIVDVAIGVSGLRPLDDLRGQLDRDGRPMRVTVRAVADELASAAELALGKTAGRPAALVRGAAPPPGDGSIADLVMPHADDLFR